jgi:hypothetical protein
LPENRENRRFAREWAGIGIAMTFILAKPQKCEAPDEPDIGSNKPDP